MKLFEPRVWSVVDLGCLKWSSILFGAIAGAYFPNFVQTYVWVFVVAFVLLGIRPMMVFYGGVRPHDGMPRATPGASS